MSGNVEVTTRVGTAHLSVGKEFIWCDDMHYLGWALPAMYDHVATVLEGLPDHWNSS